MYKGFDPHKPYFLNVAVIFILVGAGLFAIGLVEWILNMWWFYDFTAPLFKVASGLVVTSLGYIHLELELIRISRK